MPSFRIASLAVTLAAVSALPAFSADAVVYEAPVVLEEEVVSAIDISFGAAFTSRYIFRGVAQTDGPTVQGYAEASYEWAYLGVWASGVDFYDDLGLRTDRVEIDVYGGIRPTFGNLTVDLGYIHYFFDETGDCCGEVYVKPTYQFTEDFAAGAELYYDLTLETTYGALNAEYALPYDFAVSGGIGTYFEDEYDWNAGVSYTYADALTFDIRYYDSSFDRDYVVASVAFDTSLSALRGMFGNR